MLAALVGAAVIFGQQIDQQLALLGMLFFQADGESDFVRFGIEIVDEEYPIQPRWRVTRTDGSPTGMTVKSPQPTSGTSLRMRMIRSVQFSNESGCRR